MIKKPKIEKLNRKIFDKHFNKGMKKGYIGYSDGVYIPKEKTIYLKKNCSLSTLIHELCHHYFHTGNHFIDELIAYSLSQYFDPIVILLLIIGMLLIYIMNPFFVLPVFLFVSIIPAFLVLTVDRLIRGEKYEGI